MFFTQLICCRTGTSKLPEMRQRMTWKKLYIAGSYAPYSYYWCLYREFTVRIFTRIPLFRMSLIRSMLPRCKLRTMLRTLIFSMKKLYELAFRICPDTAVCAPFYSAAHRSVSQCRSASGQYSSVVSFFQKFLSAYWRIQKSVQLQDSGLYPQKWWQKIPYSIRNLSCILDALAEIHSGFFRVPFFSVPLLLLSAFFAMFFILYMEVFYHVSKYYI